MSFRPQLSSSNSAPRSFLFVLLSSPIILIGLSLVILVLLFFAFFQRIQSSAQDAQYESFPHEPWHPMLARPSAFERASIPESGRFGYPLGTQNGAFSYNAQVTGVLNTKRGGYHTGDDLNGIGGQDTDFNDPIFCPTDGFVLYTGEPSVGWGKVVILAHRVDGKILTTQYAHLARVGVRVGQVLDSRAYLGRLGTSAASSFAHLHWEWRQGLSLSVLESAYRKDLPASWHQLPAEIAVQKRLNNQTIGWPSLKKLQFAKDNQEQKIDPILIHNSIGSTE